MNERHAIWKAAAEHFDRLIDLAPADRADALDALELPDEVLSWLERMLEAHDQPEPLLIDREVTSLARGVLGDGSGPSDWPDYSGQDFGPWRAREEIGRGGMGVVYRGRRADGQFDMPVAIKVLAPARGDRSSVQLSRRELEVLAELRHPAIAGLLDGGSRPDGVAYVVMELVDGRPIDELARDEELGLPARVRLVEQVAEAVAWCHRHLVVHGDIKPSNVLVDSSGRVRLLDFGIASRLTEGDAAGDETLGPAWCSPGCCAPERLRGAAPSVAEDVFALGALLYQLLSGQGIRDSRELTRWILTREAPPAPPLASRSAKAAGRHDRARELRGDLDAICRRCLRDDPEDRYASADALAHDLRAWLEQRPVAAREGGTAYRLGRWVSRNRWLAATASLGLAGLVLGLVLALWQADRARSAQAEAEAALRTTEASLARVSALRDFLVDLFLSADPGRAPGELPSTAAILELGAERALSNPSLAEDERFELLLTLGEVHRGLNRPPRARDLLEAALETIDRRPDLGPLARARALRQLAWLDIMQRDMDAGLERHRQARALAEAGADEELAVQLGAEAAFLHFMRGDLPAARGEIDATTRRLEALEASPASIVHSVMNARGMILDQVGDRARSLAAFERSAEAARQVWGPGSRRELVVRNNAGRVALKEGEFQLARREYLDIIDAYRRLHEGQPTEFEAAAMSHLAQAELGLGHFEEAYQIMDRAYVLWAEAIEAPDAVSGAGASRRSGDREFMRALLGSWVHYRSRRIEAADQRLSGILELESISDEPGADPDNLTRAFVLAAATACRLGRLEQGLARLQTATDRIAASALADPRHRAELAEARAWCLERQGRIDEALAEARAGLALLEPGWILQKVELSLLLMELLDTVGEGAEIDAICSSSGSEIDALGLANDHPVRGWLLESGCATARSRLVSEP
ncbi:serine/threonine-protein kinase [Wenzhouxiangella marina]|uniref:Protein kinase domain-containing protein n=1 Tax=Wenzhouxiangella marina TaxID=1579979 RepID=A0A0K0XUE2_9GAMM|nr:serine/threonine-protein kinase [Wenzhouxiangella marina]AKS41334.1 hypothetical protein WM2015_953 [Wenzhouxiangella marina]MBB6086916.1 serine/threonine-protein kinase [Wenzhouxiangella marina]